MAKTTQDLNRFHNVSDLTAFGNKMCLGVFCLPLLTAQKSSLPKEMTRHRTLDPGVSLAEPTLDIEEISKKIGCLLKYP